MYQGGIDHWGNLIGESNNPSNSTKKLSKNGRKIVTECKYEV
jgi:hypothetical protein